MQFICMIEFNWLKFLCQGLKIPQVRRPGLEN